MVAVVFAKVKKLWFVILGLETIYMVQAVRRIHLSVLSPSLPC